MIAPKMHFPHVDEFAQIGVSLNLDNQIFPKLACENVSVNTASDLVTTKHVERVEVYREPIGFKHSPVLYNVPKPAAIFR